MSAQVTEAHILATRAIQVAFSRLPYAEAMEKVAQLIADSEAKAVEAYAVATRELLQGYMTERDQLRAERDKLLGYYHEIVAELGDDLALKCIRDLRAEVERFKIYGTAELAAINPNVESYCKHWEARAERAEAELAKDRARLDWLEKVDPTSPQWDIICDHVNIRAAVDAAIKEEAK